VLSVQVFSQPLRNSWMRIRLSAGSRKEQSRIP
jgi:hypothetical protein